MSARIVIPLNDSWQFQADLQNEGLQHKWYEQGLPSGEPVHIPHTWNVQNGLQDFRGTGWYSYEFVAPAQWEAQLLRLQFEAVYRDVVVWVNGKRVGMHTQSGYTAFVVDISDAVVLQTTNRIVVSANNENSSTALPMGNSFDWADDGGIIRDVSLIVSGSTAIDYAKLQAIPVFSQDVHEASAPYGLLSGEIRLWGAGCEAKNRPLQLKVTITSKDGIEASQDWEMFGNEGILRFNDLKVQDLNLWHFDHPHLYHVDMVLSTDGSITDELSVTVGFREIRTEGSTLLLNREPVRLFGVEWMPGSNPMNGMAETTAQLEEMLGHIKQANCIITRFHWQQDHKLLQWCDQNGLLVQEEIPHWQTPNIPTDEWLSTSIQHAEEMIHRHYNHACIYAWGLGNELDGQSELTVRYLEQLKSLVRKLDNTRCINYVSNTVQENPAKDATAVGDMIMWNDYIGTWHGNLDRSEVIQSITRGISGKPLVIAEYGLCEPAFEGGDERRNQILLENTIEYRRHPEIAALIYFSLNDYRTQMGEEGEGNFKQRVHGSMDLKGVPKPSYETLRNLASPVQVYVGQEEPNTIITVEVRKDIPCYSISGYTLRIIDPISGCIQTGIAALYPGEQQVFPFAKLPLERWNELRLEITRPTGFSVTEGPLSRFANRPVS